MKFRLKMASLCFCFYLFAWVPGVQAEEAGPRLVTVTPVLQLLGETLVMETGIELEYLPPSRLPLNRIPAWLYRVDPGDLPQADGLLTLESLVTELAIYPALRRKNIRIVPVDAAQELAPGGAQVSLHPERGGQDYFWLDLNNMIVMLNIMSRDLSRLWPDAAAQLEDNRRTASAAIQRAAMQVDEHLFTQQISSLSLSDARLTPLALMTALPLEEAPGGDLLIAPSPVEGQATWVVEPLNRPTQLSLQAWLDGLVAGLVRHQ
ncbi:hypothetical protein [Marinospirillum sp.]|uniref:hypothetical protein n=1 Tax=Marinospirillum sp. TaxID=2183934 RepID=UPI0028709982|nr:hypothetical protein [Marinospirillum sp.]MDR9466872.1 hypothetical protein [Marinospirillum sp.]